MVSLGRGGKGEGSYGRLQCADSNVYTESELLVLLPNFTSNVALPLFEPSNEGTLVAFDSNEHLNIQTQSGTPFYNWYVPPHTLYLRPREQELTYFS